MMISFLPSVPAQAFNFLSPRALNILHEKYSLLAENAGRRRYLLTVFIIAELLWIVQPKMAVYPRFSDRDPGRISLASVCLPMFCIHCFSAMSDCPAFTALPVSCQTPLLNRLQSKREQAGLNPPVLYQIPSKIILYFSLSP